MDETEKRLLDKSRKYLRILRIVPFVRMISVCNNLAFGKVDETSDIDLFVVARTGRLFFVRTFVTLLLQVMGVRRHGKKVAGRFCLSFFVDEEGMDLEKIAIDHDVYLAFWIQSMLPFIDNAFCSNELIERNTWAKSFFENEDDFFINLNNSFGASAFSSFLEGILSFIFDGRFGDFLEDRLLIWQLKRAKGKAVSLGDEASIIVNEHILKFHNLDRRKEYRRLWEKRFGQERLSAAKFLEIKPYS